MQNSKIQRVTSCSRKIVIEGNLLLSFKCLRHSKSVWRRGKQFAVLHCCASYLGFVSDVLGQHVGPVFFVDVVSLEDRTHTLSRNAVNKPAYAKRQPRIRSQMHRKKASNLTRLLQIFFILVPAGFVTFLFRAR